MYTLKKKFLGLLLFFLSCLSGKAQVDADQKRLALKSLIDAKQFAFIPQSATTQKGNTIPLSPGNGLKILGDSLQVDLPYYGRAYTTTYPPNNAMGIHFSSHSFSYQADTTKKGGWDITIKPRGEKVFAIYLSVSSSGYTSVRINSNDRDPISYYGSLTVDTGY